MSSESRTEIAVIESAHGTEIQILGIPEAWSQGSYPDFVGGDMYLRSSVQKGTGSVEHGLVVKSSYFRREGISWYSASDEHSQTFEFVPMEHRMDQGGSLSGNSAFTEVFELSIPEDYLREHRGGVRITVYGRTGPDIDLRIFPRMIAAQYDAIAAALAGEGPEDG